MSLVVPVQVRYKLATAVVDTGAQITIMSIRLFESLKWPMKLDMVCLTGLDPDKKINGYRVEGVDLTIGGNTNNMTIYIAPTADDLLLGLDFMVSYKVDILVSKNILVLGGKEEVPAILKQSAVEEYSVG